MQFVYSPEGAEPRTWPFHARKLLNAEAIAIERFTGMTFPEWEEKLQNGSILATQALLWVLLKRDEPTLKPDSVVFTPSEVALKFDDVETAAMIANLEKVAEQRQLDEGEEVLLEMLRAGDPTTPDEGTDAAAGDDDERAGDEDPKDD